MSLAMGSRKEHMSDMYVVTLVKAKKKKLKRQVNKNHFISYTYPADMQQS